MEEVSVRKLVKVDIGKWNEWLTSCKNLEVTGARPVLLRVFVFFLLLHYLNVILDVQILIVRE